MIQITITKRQYVIAVGLLILAVAVWGYWPESRASKVDSLLRATGDYLVPLPTTDPKITKIVCYTASLKANMLKEDKLRIASGSDGFAHRASIPVIQHRPIPNWMI